MITNPKAFPLATRRRLDLLIGKYFPLESPARQTRGSPRGRAVADLLVVGSVALDSVATPFGKVDEALGGSATYFSYAASFFTPVRLVATVGGDFPEDHVRLLQKRGVDVAGLQRSAGGRTFRWVGEYGYDLNEARTLDTQLNVLATFRPDPAGRPAPGALSVPRQHRSGTAARRPAPDGRTPPAGGPRHHELLDPGASARRSCASSARSTSSPSTMPRPASSPESPT